MQIGNRGIRKQQLNPGNPTASLKAKTQRPSGSGTAATHILLKGATPTASSRSGIPPSSSSPPVAVKTKSQSRLGSGDSGNEDRLDEEDLSVPVTFEVRILTTNIAVKRNRASQNANPEVKKESIPIDSMKPDGANSSKGLAAGTIFCQEGTNTSYYRQYGALVNNREERINFAPEARLFGK